MKGNEVDRIERDLQVSTAQLAELLGVYPGTIYRWKKNGQFDFQCQPLHDKLLAYLKQRSRFDAQGLGLKIREGIKSGGPLGGLAVLLQDYEGTRQDWD